MKRLFLFFFLVSSTAVFGQYSFEPKDAPTNVFPIRYKIEHFRLNGPIAEYDDGIGKYYFNDKGLLVKDESMLGSVTDYIYDSRGRLSKVVSEIWGSTLTYTVTYDNAGRPKAKRDSFTLVGDVYVYDAQGDYIEKRDGQNNSLQVTYAYDSQHRLIRTTSYFTSTNSHSVKTYTYKESGNSLEVSSIYTPHDGEAKTYNTFYYDSNGDYCGNTPCNGGKARDKYGNALNWINADGSPGGDKMYKYLDGTTSSNYTNTDYMDMANDILDDIDSNSSSNNNNTSGTADVATPVSPVSTTTASNKGCVRGDCKNGWGKYNYDNGYYDGYWSNGNKTGYGLYGWNDGGTYLGNWQNDEMTGYGVYTAANKDIIKGIFVNGELNGLGVTKTGDKWDQGKYSNGNLIDRYDFYSTNATTGCTVGDCQNKYGKMVWSNGDTYVGFFKNGQLHLGTYTFSSGASYSGQFNGQSQFHGMGRWWSDGGDYYGGSWKNGKMDGQGYYSKKDPDEIQIGDFAAGTFVKSKG